MAGKTLKKWILLVANEAVMDETVGGQVAALYPEWKQHSYYSTEAEADDVAQGLLMSAKVFGVDVVEA